MRQESEQPQARTSGLVVKGVGEELLVYDLARHQAHSLNRVAAAVWRACDGTRGVAALGGAAARESGHAVPAESVRYALQSLGRAQLLEGPGEKGGLTRREVMARLGTAAAVALPLVTTIIAPTAAQAQSPTCFNENEGPCNPSAPNCCPAACGGGNCICVFSKDKFRCVRPTIGDPPKQ
jgi:coenzyme PQQ synthesis protein D (PqqD)